VGNPLDLDLPPRSAALREDAMDRALDDYEQVFNIKAAADLEFLILVKKKPKITYKKFLLKSILI